MNNLGLRNTPLPERRGLGWQRKDGPDFLHPSDGFLAGAKAQAEFAAEAVHTASQMDQQEPVFLEPRGAFFDGEAQAPDRTGNIISEQR